jgi:hypothetical protein
MATQWRAKNAPLFLDLFSSSVWKKHERFILVLMYHEYREALDFLRRSPSQSPYIQSRLSRWTRGLLPMHEWMIGVGFVALLMTPCLIAMRTGVEDSDER